MTTFTLKQLVARVPYLSRVYESTYFERGVCYPIDIEYSEQRRRGEMTIYADGDYALPDSETLRSRLFLPDGVPMTFHPFNAQEGRLPQISVVLAGLSFEELSNLLPPLQAHGGGRHYAVEPFASGAVLSPLLQCFALAYVLGMVARYYPTVWLGLLSRQAGDRELPLLRAASAHVFDTFPSLIWEIVEPDPIDDAT